MFFFCFLGDDAMFGDAEHYKYLTNEADLNNVGDDSIALTPKTPKRDQENSLSKLANNQQTPTNTNLDEETVTRRKTAISETTPTTEDEHHSFINNKKQSLTNNNKSPSNNNFTNIATPNGGTTTMATSLGNITMAESMDGSYYNGYDSNKNVNQIECDNIPVESRPKAAG